MDVEIIFKELVKAATAVQRESGRPVGSVEGTVCPIGAWAEFESINGLEVGLILEERLGVEINFNPFATEDGRRPLDFRKAAVRIHQFVEAKGGNAHD